MSLIVDCAVTVGMAWLWAYLVHVADKISESRDRRERYGSRPNW